MYDAPRTHTSQSRSMSLSVFCSAAMESLQLPIVLWGKTLSTLPLNSINSLALGKGPNRYSSLGNWTTNGFLQRIRFYSKYVYPLAIKCTEVQADGPSKAPDFGNYYRPYMSEVEILPPGNLQW